MKSPKSKRKLTTEDICREYYESQLFRPTGNDVASPSGFFLNLSIDLELIDASFKGIDYTIFLLEMAAVNVELFGLAWLSHNYELSKEISLSDSSIPEEIVFTKRYLQDTGRGNIWERMSFYNDVILKTVVDETIKSERWGVLRDIPADVREEDREKIAEMSLTEPMKHSIDLFSKYITDSECRDRLVIRLLAIPCDISRITLLSQKLSLTLTERLGREPKQAGFFALQRVIVSLYMNAVNYLDAVHQYGSYEAYKDKRRALLQNIKRVVREQQQK
jgi:hypothetical protein